MGNPIFLLDGVISTGQFCEWLDVHDENHEEKTIWEYYLQKLGAWDDRSFADFKRDILKGRPTTMVEKPTEEQVSATVKKSFDMFKTFEISQEGG